MTPIQCLTTEPPRYVIIHELGHALVGLALQLNEDCIEFLRPGGGQIARAHWNRMGATPRERIMRAFGGMYLQALVEHESISRSVRSCLLDGTFTKRYRSEIESKRVPSELIEDGFAGDWLDMLDASRTASLNGTFRVLTSAYRGVPRIFEKHRLERFVDPLVKDVYVWLRTDEEFLEPQDTILYPISRARALFDTTSTTPSRTQ